MARTEPVSAPAPVLPPRPAAAPAADEWQIQVGAFRRQGAAEEHVRWLSGRVPELAGRPVLVEPAGPLVRARLAGFDGEQAARGLCARVRQAEAGCLVVPPG